MGSRVYKTVEIVATSPDGLEQAIENGVARATETIRNIDWFEVTEIRGHIADDKVAHYQVGLKLGFRLDNG